MNRRMQLIAIPPCMEKIFIWLPILFVSIVGDAWSACTPASHNINSSACVVPEDPDDCPNGISPCDPNVCTYGVTVGQEVENQSIAGDGDFSLPGSQWAILNSPGSTASCDGITMIKSLTCFGIEFDYNGSSVGFDSDNVLYSDPNDVEILFQVTNGINSCSRMYIPHITSSGGGWGDPHVKTVDNVNYDFQAAGEFTLALGDGLEIQTRQSPVSTSHVPAPNGYTDIASCVSIYTAVAARVGDHRVTIQPNLSGEPDPSGVQIRVDGKLRTLGPNGIDLSSCNCSTDEIKSGGRIVRSADEQSIEVHYPDDTKLVVTPAWSNSMKKWYMNINVYDTTATEGVMGRVVDRWLPALSDGTSVGPKATTVEERYKQLNEIFADSWRVTDDTSLFDYAEDTSTDTFTLKSWPRNNPDSCLLEGEPVMVPVDEAVAKEWCSIVVDENNRENCIFDVRETGIFGFADAYARSERIVPGNTRTVLVQDRNRGEQDSAVIFTATVQRSVSTVGKINSGVVQFLLNGENTGDPTEFDINRNAVWRASQLSRGVHTLEARFLPSGFGERFRPSSSKVEFKY